MIRLIKSLFRFFSMVIWRSFFLSKRDKECIEEHENWSYPTDEFEEEGKVLANGKKTVSTVHSKILLKILVDSAKLSWKKKIRINYKTWKWFLRKEFQMVWRKNVKRHFCKHKGLSNGQWDFMKQQGYRYCYRCWEDFYDEKLSFEDCNCGVQCIET